MKRKLLRIGIWWGVKVQSPPKKLILRVKWFLKNELRISFPEVGCALYKGQFLNVTVSVPNIDGGKVFMHAIVNFHI